MAQGFVCESSRPLLARVGMTDLRKLPILTVILGLATLWALPLQAQDAAKEPSAEAKAAATELFEVMDLEMMMKGATEQALEPQLIQMRRAGISELGMAELKKEMLDFMNEVMAWEVLKPELVDLYATEFTKEELDDLIAFYKTPTGQKAIKTMPRLMGEGMMIGQRAVQARAPELQQRIAPIIQRELQMPKTNPGLPQTPPSAPGQ